MMGLHVVDVKSGEVGGFWEVHLSNGYVVHVLKTRCPDELSAYAYATNRLKEEQANGTNSRASRRGCEVE